MPADLCACAVKESYPHKEMKITASHYLGNFLASHDAALNPSQTKKKKKLTISRHFCSTFHQTTKSSKQQTATLIQFQTTPLSITCWCVFLHSGGPDSANLSATVLLSPTARENYICFLKFEELVPLTHTETFCSYQLLTPNMPRKPTPTPQIAHYSWRH